MYKVEKKPVLSRHKNGELREFVLTLKALKVGESFLIPTMSASNYRMAISVAQMLLGVEFTTRAEGDSKTRVARTA
jgi:hypothetical protein